MTQTRAQTPTRAPTPDRNTVPRLEPRASVRLTGRGALASLFALCFVTQLIADWTGWGTLAGAAFVCGCGAVTYYTRTSGLRTVVVAPPLLFFAGAACAELIASGLAEIAPAEAASAETGRPVSLVHAGR